MAQPADEYDVLVIGSGVAGGTLGLSLKQLGLKTLVIEHKSHPRFTIGESTIPSTSAGFRWIGQRFHVPELFEMTTYLKSKQLGLTSYPKCHFYFAWHASGQALQPRHQMIFETYRPPLGPDTHLVRADLDYFLTTLYPKYGVEYRDRTSVQGFRNDKEKFVEVDLKNNAVEDSPIYTVKARFVVDATGHSAFLGRKFGLLQKDAKLHTRTRTIYGHFRYKNDWSLDRLLGGPCKAFRYLRDAGTMHHCFEGGWIWVIPFENNTVSVGIVLDMTAYPFNHEISKEEEFQRMIEKFPTVNAHLSILEPIMPLVRTGRLQLMSDSIIGNRFLLTPHAAGFIDALFSTGINLTTRFILRNVPLIREAILKEKSTGIGIDMEIFRENERRFFTEVAFIDRMVNGMIKSFRSFDLFRQYWRIWIDGTTRQIQDVHARGDPTMPLYGSHHVDFNAACKQAHEIVTSDTSEPMEVAKRVKTVLDTVPSAYARFPMHMFGPKWDIDFPYPTNVMVPMHTVSMTQVALAPVRTPILVTYWMFNTMIVMLWFYIRYFASLVVGTRFHKDVDFISSKIIYKHGQWVKVYAKAIIPILKAFFFKKSIYENATKKSN